MTISSFCEKGKNHIFTKKVAVKCLKFNRKTIFALFKKKLYPGGGIGRRASLRGWCPQGRAGSTPVLGTLQKKWVVNQ